jgi:hypothetical protein
VGLGPRKRKRKKKKKKKRKRSYFHVPSGPRVHIIRWGRGYSR